MVVELAQFFETIQDHQIMVLATGTDSKISARSVSCIIYHEKFYFQTDRNFLKIRQILQNPQVALCLSNIQIEGSALVLGHPLEKRYEIFCALYRKYYEGSYLTYTHLENEVVVQVSPKTITLWNYEAGRPYREYFDVEADTYREEYYL